MTLSNTETAIMIMNHDDQVLIRCFVLVDLSLDQSYRPELSAYPFEVDKLFLSFPSPASTDVRAAAIRAPFAQFPLSTLRNMRLSMVVAYSRLTRAIGHQGTLPWPRLKSDLSRFKKLTSYHTIIMGRKTFESCEVNSVPLSNRRNIVLSRDPGWAPPAGVVHAQDWDEALLLADAGFGGAGYDDGEHVLRASEEPRDVFVVGGETVYRTALSHACNWIFATEIDGAWPGDTFFPDLGPEWRRIEEENCPRRWALDAPVHENGVTYSFVTYHRVR